MWEIGIQSGVTVDQLGADIAFPLYREAGFTVIDWNINDGADNAGMKKGSYDKAKRVFAGSLDDTLRHFEKDFDALAKAGLKVGQAHAPYPLHPGQPVDPKYLDETLPILIGAIRFCQKMGIPNLVVHMICGFRFTPEELIALNGRVYDEILPVVKQGDTVICLENLFCTKTTPDGKTEYHPDAFAIPEEAAAAVDRLNERAGREVFGICVDSGHLNLVGQDVPAYIRTAGKRIKALHLHDNNGKADQHRAPYTGTIPWKATMEALRDAGYAGDLSFETFRQTSLDTIDKEMLLPWLKVIYACGAHFRDILKGN